MNNKAQEEIIGFVIIVVIVALVSVFLLGLSLRSPNSSNKESKDIYQFLSSSMELTTQCSISYEPDYLKLSELISQCAHPNSLCLNGEDICVQTETILKNILEAAFPVGEESPIKGYEFKSTEGNNTLSKEFISIKKGSCGTIIKGSEVLIPSPNGVISNTLKLCY